MTSDRFARLNRTALAALGALALPLAGCTTDSPNRSVESIHQPIVSHAAYTFDVQAGAGDTLSPVEAGRLDDWFSSIGLGYGDQVAIVADGYFGPSLRDGIADVVARRGLMLGLDDSAVAGSAPQGAVRLIVRRSTASVPGCPDWSAKQETEMTLGTSSNFGCGVNGNLAAMVANPEDLVRGQSTDSNLRTATSNRAISTYRDKQPTGAGELKQLQAEGR